MKTDIKIDGVMVLTGVAIIAAVVVAYKLKNVVGAVGQAVSDVVDIPVRAFNTVNNAVPPSITFDQQQSDGSIKRVTVSGAAIKQANANPTNMGMIAWPSSSDTANVSPWYSGYDVTGWTDEEKDNPFAMPDNSGDTFLYTADSPLGKIVDYVSSWFENEKKPNDYGEIINDGITSW